MKRIYGRGSKRLLGNTQNCGAIVINQDVDVMKEQDKYVCMYLFATLK